MTTYLIQVNIALILFYGIYFILLKEETNFKTARITLIFSLLASISIPLFDIEELASFFVSNNDIVYEYWLPELTINSVQQQILHNESTSLFWLIIATIYWIGVLIGLASFLFSLIRLLRLIRQSKLVEDVGGSYYSLDNDKSSFSFFRYIFVGSKSWYTESDKLTILAHERSHARLWHTADVLLIQLIKIFIWFNPIVYLYRSELEKLHEYEADSIASKNKLDEYCNLLAKDVLDTHQVAIANHFNKSLTLKRIDMMKTLKTKLSSRKKVGLLVALVLILVAIACEEKVFSDLSEHATLLSKYPADIQQNVDVILANNPDAQIKVYGIPKSSSIDLDKFYQSHGTPIAQLFRDEDTVYESYLLINRSRSELTNVVLEIRRGDIAYSNGIDPAKPLNGLRDFYRLISEAILYPRQARESGIEGQVIVKFTVDETGKLSDFQVVKGIGQACDEEVIRAIKLSPDWKPSMKNGIPIKSVFNMAFKFKLEPGLSVSNNEERMLSPEQAAMLNEGSQLSEIVISALGNNQ